MLNAMILYRAAMTRTGQMESDKNTFKQPHKAVGRPANVKFGVVVSGSVLAVATAALVSMNMPSMMV